MLEKKLIDIDRNLFVFNSFKTKMSHEGQSKGEVITALHITNLLTRKHKIMTNAPVITLFHVKKIHCHICNTFKSGIN